MEKYKFHYDAEDDVLYIWDAIREVEESVEFSEDMVLDLDSHGNFIGVEIFYASEFFNTFNNELNKEFLRNLSKVSIEYKEYRNMWFIVLLLQSGSKRIAQPLPPLRKSEYTSPLIANNS